ncbi:nuclease-related domain-containing protein [Mycoplasma procyoni]|uniref:nuclease-related domain-containing protein n=1 Tax=Mycoplasma procyoni TaxID=568784 RepID=UPI00197B5EFC|nr:nuclease-related domain-containing protein [Mycoplasma procyoni]MBN3534471.1 NERD domain-containing protein [Mycoplasma procyoni]
MSDQEIWMAILITFGAVFTLAFFISLLVIKLKYGKNLSIQERLGKEAEIRINESLSSWASKNQSFFIPSALYKYNKNQLFEVDGILLTPKVVYVIEIKSINGVIKGNSEDQKFKKIIAKKEYEIANPIKQNDKHIEHIKRMLNGNFPVISLIIYTERTESIEVINKPSHVALIKENAIQETLYDISSKLENKFSEQTLQSLKNSIEENITKDRKDYITLKRFSEKN